MTVKTHVKAAGDLPPFIASAAGFLAFIPLDLWWFLAQRGSRDGQFPLFSLLQSLARLAARTAGAVVGGLPLYLDGIASAALAGLLALLLLWAVTRTVWRWRTVGTSPARTMFALASIASPLGLLALGAIFNNTPIEVRYLAFSAPFLALLLAGALGPRTTATLLAVQAAAIVGLMIAPHTMQPAQSAAQLAAAQLAGAQLAGDWGGDGIVLLPRGNDGVGIVGAFAIGSPPTLPLLLIGARDEPERILSRVGSHRRVVLALVDQDAASHAATVAMRSAFRAPGWREVAHGPNVAVYERAGDQE